MLRRHWTFLIALLPLLGWWTYGLFDLDEGFYAAIAAEMNRRGEWITPYFNGQPWFEKPILIYWFLKPSIALFGDMVGPRLPSVLATVATYALCAWFAKRHLSEGAAKWVPIILGSSLLIIGAGRMALTDPLLNLSLVGAFVTFYESLVGDRRWRIAAAGCLGLAMLAKGPMAGGVFIPAAAWTYWKAPSLRPAFKGQWLPGIALFLLVVASWYVPCYLQNGQLFVHEFLYEQNWRRFLGGDEAHKVPLWWGWTFYPILLSVGFAPWWWFLRRSWKGSDPAHTYLKAWGGTVFIIFTISGAKLPHYILPALPPFALLIAAHFGNVTVPVKKVVAGMIAATAVANAAFLIYYYGLNLGSIKLPGFHNEVHQLTRYVRDHATPEEDIAMFALPKQKDAPKKPGVHLNETSHPSLLLYLNRTALDTKDWDKILAETKPVWIITRYGRVTPEDEAAAGPRLHAVDPFPPDLYRLYKLDPARP